MSDESIFPKGDTPPEETPGSIAIPDSVKDLVGPGKKYPTLEAALNSIPHAQSHIATLEQEMKELRGSAGQGVSQEELLSTVKELLDQERKTHGTSAQVDEAAISGLFDREFEKRKEKEIADANEKVVLQAMRNKYGDKAEEMYAQRAKELGVGSGFLTAVVRKSSDAALQLLELEKPKTADVTATKGSINTAALPTNTQSVQKPRSVMNGATTGQMIEEWRRHNPLNKE